MEIREYINTTKKDVDSQKYNIFIPICLGNKFFMEKNLINENVEKYLNWALEHTKNKILFLVADKVQYTNYYVRNKRKTEKASLNRVLKDGKEIKKGLEKLVKKLPKNKRDKVDIIQWEDYENYDSFYCKTTSLVYKEFKNNKDFRKEVLRAVKNTVTDRKFDEDKYLKLCNYVLDEFSLSYSGVDYKKYYYEMMIYPKTDSTVYFFEEIKSGKSFPKLHEKLPKEKVAVVILN